ITLVWLPLGGATSPPPYPHSVVSPVSVPSCPSWRSVLLPTEESPGVIPGIVGAIVVALGGAISSFIAYQKKKLCFKENAEEGQVNMENHRTTAEPAVQQTLLEK
ncbi:PREDICTED: CD99 antigen, partial [Bison bison bison]|uniref:CD99 antigen n=1 Tax=Bison bison bison TaxID=43346 RepID=A0A6P3H895_BISBB